MICLASAVMLEEETPIEPQKSQNRNVGGRGSLKDIHASLLLEACLSPAIDQVNHGFVYPKSLKSPGMEIPQPPWAAFSSISSSSQWKKVYLFHQLKPSKLQFVAAAPCYVVC